MDAAGLMILPKGIVTNTKDIYKEVADYSVVPPDKVWKYWHVYTTTYKKLKDPTACRLENFWWHVWGSDRRFLKGSALAKLYEDISLGPTFVPLKGPPNRWEGPDIPPLLRQIIEAAAAAEAQQQHQQATPRPVLEPSTKEQSQPQQLHPAQASRSPTKPTDASTKILSSSASKPPPTHPILKKARGPSSSGPRPTARFISPQESAEEDEKESEFPSSGSTIATDNRAYITSPTKKTFNSTKKFVASTTAAKRRPLLPRRQSSQTSGNTEAGTRESGSSAGSKHAGNSTAKQVNSQAASASDDSSSSVPTERPAERPTISAKAAGKRPAVQRRRTSEKKHLTKQEPRPPVAPIRSPPAEPVRAAALTQARSMVNLPGHSRTASGKDLPSSALSPEAPTMMARAQSHTGYEHRRETSIGRAPLQGLFTGATASTTNVAAQGTILDQSGLDTTALPGMLDQHRQRHMIPGQSPSSSLLDSRFTPTQPTTLGSVPLGRTKSQLTLLLERENAKIGNRPRSKS